MLFSRNWKTDPQLRKGSVRLRGKIVKTAENSQNDGKDPDKEGIEQNEGVWTERPSKVKYAHVCTPEQTQVSLPSSEEVNPLNSRW